MNNAPLSEQEKATIQAALRHFRATTPNRKMGRTRVIAEHVGLYYAVPVNSEIDALCERFNFTTESLLNYAAIFD
jgi:hypothetical protein